MSEQSVNKETRELIKEMMRVIVNFEGQRPLVMDVKGFSPITDYFITADFQSFVQMQGAHESLLKLVKERGFFIEKQNNMNASRDWIILDAGSVVCHLMTREARSFFNLEKLWEKGTILNEI